MDTSDRLQHTNPHRADDQPLTEAEQADYFGSVLSAALTAEAKQGCYSVDIALAGTRCRLVFAGEPASIPFLPALQHLRLSEDGEPDVTLHVWASDSSGVEMPPPPVTQDCFTNRGDIWRMNSKRFRAAFHWIESSVNLYDTERRVGVHWVPGTALLPFWAKASPFRTLFSWWLESIGGQLIHGAAFGTADGAVLLTGKGGVGKSTTALTCLTNGLSYIGDDYLAVRLDPEPRVYSLYCTAKLERDQMLRFPSLERLVAQQGFRQQDKAVVQLLPDFAAQVTREMPLKAIASPCFGNGPTTTLTPVTKLALQRAASFTTLSQLPHAGAYLHQFMNRLVHAVPGMTLSLGTHLPAIPDTVRHMLALTNEERAEISATRDALPLEKLLSVIIPVYNGAHFVGDAVRCVLEQNYPHLEIIIVDDGSTDGIAAAVDRLPVEVRLLHQENAGPAAARNRGIRDAAGEYVAFLDVDDLWPAGNLRHLVRLLEENPDAEVVHGRGQMMRVADGGDEFVGDPRESFPYYIGAGVYRRSAFLTNGLFNPMLRYGEDSDWFIRAAEKPLPIHKVEEVCLYLRRHGGNMTHGKSMLELNGLRVIKMALDRRRAGASSTLSA